MVGCVCVFLTWLEPNEVGWAGEGDARGAPVCELRFRDVTAAII